MWSYAQVGISIPHYSGAQMVTPRAIPVPLDKMLPGDLMYFGAGGSRHAAIYIGNGQVVEANNPSTGVRIDPAFASWNMYDYAGSTRLIY
jgi:cell wall-associated NlpC family hydrolase